MTEARPTAEGREAQVSENPIVVKVGGAEGVDADSVCRDVVDLWRSGRRLVLVHGGSAATSRLQTRLGTLPRFVTSPSGHTSRYTDAEALAAFRQAVCGEVNKGLVERLQALHANALGLAGVDGRLLTARRKSSIRVVEDGRVMVLHGDYTGTVQSVDARLLSLLLGHGYLPVVAPLGLTEEGESVNLDADRVAAAVAVALGSPALVLLTDVPGLLEDPDRPDSLVPRLELAEQERAMVLAKGRMKRKVLAAFTAVAGGVGCAVIAGSRTQAPLTRALAGGGTWISAGMAA